MSYSYEVTTTFALICKKGPWLISSDKPPGWSKNRFTIGRDISRSTDPAIDRALCQPNMRTWPAPYIKDHHQSSWCKRGQFVILGIDWSKILTCGPWNELMSYNRGFFLSERKKRDNGWNPPCQRILVWCSILVIQYGKNDLPQIHCTALF